MALTRCSQGASATLARFSDSECRILFGYQTISTSCSRVSDVDNLWATMNGAPCGLPPRDRANALFDVYRYTDSSCATLGSVETVAASGCFELNGFGNDASATTTAVWDFATETLSVTPTLSDTDCGTPDTASAYAFRDVTPDGGCNPLRAGAGSVEVRRSGPYPPLVMRTMRPFAFFSDAACTQPVHTEEMAWDNVCRATGYIYPGSDARDQYASLTSCLAGESATMQYFTDSACTVNLATSATLTTFTADCTRSTLFSGETTYARMTGAPCSTSASVYTVQVFSSACNSPGRGRRNYQRAVLLGDCVEDNNAGYGYPLDSATASVNSAGAFSVTVTYPNCQPIKNNQRTFANAPVGGECMDTGPYGAWTASSVVVLRAEVLSLSDSAPKPGLGKVEVAVICAFAGSLVALGVYIAIRMRQHRAREEEARRAKAQVELVQAQNARVLEVVNPVRASGGSIVTW